MLAYPSLSLLSCRLVRIKKSGRIVGRVVVSSTQHQLFPLLWVLDAVYPSFGIVIGDTTSQLAIHGNDCQRVVDSDPCLEYEQLVGCRGSFFQL